MWLRNVAAVKQVQKMKSSQVVVDLVYIHWMKDSDEIWIKVHGMEKLERLDTWAVVDGSRAPTMS